MTLNSTLCYIERDGQYLMLYRNRKLKDPNGGKWVGVGGKFEAGESPEECILREIREETGLGAPRELRYRGIVTFSQGDYTEYMHLFTCRAPEDYTPIDCNEGELHWVDKGKVQELNMWEGDAVFFRLMRETEDFFSLKLTYEGEKVVDVRTCIYGNAGGTYG